MKAFALILLLLFESSYARSGGIVGNGADYTTVARAWFLGEKDIDACYEVAPGFPISKEDAAEIINDSFLTWKTYVEKKLLKSAWPEPRPFLNFQYTLRPSCVGSEDLTFYFGLSNARVTEGAKHFVDPRAFSFLESYDSRTGRGKGFVWVNKRTNSDIIWSPYGQILALIKHELGHIYGCDHVPGTIMREDIGAFLEKTGPLSISKREAEYFPNMIDQQRELYIAPTRGVHALQNILVEPNPAIRELFKRLYGRDYVGAIWMAFKHASGSNSHLAELYVGDETGKAFAKPRLFTGPRLMGKLAYHTMTRNLNGEAFMMELDQGSKVDFSRNDIHVFNSVWLGIESGYEVPGFLIQGKLIIDKKTGEKIPITYSRNRGNDEYVRLLINSDTAGGSKEIFRAFLYDQPFY